MQDKSIYKNARPKMTYSPAELDIFKENIKKFGIAGYECGLCGILQPNFRLVCEACMEEDLKKRQNKKKKKCF